MRDQEDNPPSVFLFSTDAAREIDRRAQAEYGLPTIVLMENAARALAELVTELIDASDDPGGRVLILAGSGNNGGDGTAAARHLANLGLPVAIVLAGEPRDGSDAAINLRVCRAMGVPVHPVAPGRARSAVDAGVRSIGGPPTVIVDAILGTGLSRPPEGVALELIEECNRLRTARAAVVAVDVPSGLDAESGAPEGGSPAIVVADVTLAMGGLKPGLMTAASGGYVGDVAVGDIGVPAALLAELGTPVDPEAFDPASDDPERA